jgi:hypothetical protein
MKATEDAKLMDYYDGDENADAMRLAAPARQWARQTDAGDR